MEYSHISVKCEGRVFWLTIDRPAQMNAVSPATSREMAHAFDAFEQDGELWVAIVTGAGDMAFCAGGDINAMAQAKTEADYDIPGSGYGGLTHRFSCDKPIIAAVNGLALGGGFEIALSCDLIIAVDTANFGLPEPMLGTAAVASGMHRLVRHIGLKPAMNLLLTGHSIDAQKAEALGLVNEVVAADQLMATAEKYARRILKCAPLAVQTTKQCVMRGLEEGGVEAAMKKQLGGDYPLMDTMLKSDDLQEGLQAFLEKRKPEWRGL